MAKINGSLILVYSNGTLVATQKSCTVSWEQDLIDTTNKSSSGWEEHINGVRRCTCDFDALYSTTGLSAESLIAYLTARTDLVLLIDGGGYPIIGEARLKNVSVNTPMEDAVTISGSFTFDGEAWMLSGTFAQMITDPDAGGTDYDTFTISGISVSSAINAASTAYANSNTISIADTGVYKLVTFLTLTSGELPSVGLWDNTSAFISNEVALVEGVNVVTLTATSTDSTASLRIHNTDAANFALTNIYLFKV